MVWKANFAQEPTPSAETGAKKSTTKAKIRPSLAGGMQGVDVQRVVGSSAVEEKHDIEEANLKSRRSASLEELQLIKKAAEMHISKPASESSSESSVVVASKSVTVDTRKVKI